MLNELLVVAFASSSVLNQSYHATAKEKDQDGTIFKKSLKFVPHLSPEWWQTEQIIIFGKSDVWTPNGTYFKIFVKNVPSYFKVSIKEEALKNILSDVDLVFNLNKKPAQC